MAKKSYKYSWTKTYNADPQAVGDWLQSLRVRTPEAIVEAAADPVSPVHHLIWDTPDSEAARQYRLVLARVMVNSLRIEIVDSQGKPKHVNAFIGSIDRTGYVVTLEATSDELGVAERKCWQQMKRFRQQYNDLKFAEEVVSAIEITERKAVRQRKKA